MQCNLNLVMLKLVTTCDLASISQRPFFNLPHKIIRFSDSFLPKPKVSLNQDRTGPVGPGKIEQLE